MQVWNPGQNVKDVMINFLLLVNKQGQPRIVQEYASVCDGELHSLMPDIIKKCLIRDEKQCSFFEYKNIRIVYRKYATLYFILGVDDEENELAILEFIHNIVETFDKYFKKVCELDILFNLDKAHFILNEMILNGHIVETNKNRILAPVLVMDQAGKK